MAKISGVNCFMGVALDNTTWGTWKTHQLSVKHLVKEDLHLVKPYSFAEFLSGHAQRLAPIPDQSHIEGTIEMANSYEGCEHLIWYALGGAAAVGNTQNVPAVTSTAGKFAFSVPTTTAALPTLGLSLSMERSLELYKYPGCYVKSAEWQFKSGKPGVDRYTVIGPTETAATIEAATNVRPFVPLLGTEGTITTAAGGICAYIKEASIKIENPMWEDGMSLCSLDMLQPVRSGDMKISGSLTGWWDNTATVGTKASLYGPFVGGTDINLSLIWSGNQILSSGVNYRKELLLPACRLTPTGTPTASGPGVCEVTWGFEAYYNGSANPLTINLWNSNVTTLA
jgi:hypothetical protein